MAEDDVFHLRIKSFKDVEIAVPSGSVVAHVKQQVRAALRNPSLDKDEEAQEEERFLRLICKGRLLSPDDHPISDFNVQNGDVVHAVLAPVVKSGDTSRSDTHRRRRRNGTTVGPGGRVTRVPNSSPNGDDESSSDESHGDEETGGAQRQRRGFDQLRSSGLSRQEITAIRAYFSRHVDRHVQTQPQAHSDEPDARRRRLLIEEDWMELQGPTSEFRMNLNQNTLLRFANLETNLRSSMGTDRDFWWGFIMGFFLGFITLVWVWMPTLPYKQKVGIMMGITLHLFINVSNTKEAEDYEGP